MRAQPRNHRAVMAGRREPRDSLDMFPTPMWGTRALLKHVLRPHIRREHIVLDPCCGHGHMAVPLAEYFEIVLASDVKDYGYGDVANFLDPGTRHADVDWTIANPPFNLANPFTLKALKMSRRGVAILAQTRWLEGINRYNTLFKKRPPTYVGVFVERLSLVRGRLDPTARTATSYAWFCWVHSSRRKRSELVHIPPGTRQLLTHKHDGRKP